MDNVTLIRVVAGFFALFIFIPLYFLPAFLARKKRQFLPILLLNIFLAWTLIGWVGALIWALAGQPKDFSTQPGAVLCSYCGRYSAAGSQYCSNCGRTLFPIAPIAR